MNASNEISDQSMEANSSTNRSNSRRTRRVGTKRKSCNKRGNNSNTSQTNNNSNLQDLHSIVTQIVANRSLQTNDSQNHSNEESIESTVNQIIDYSSGSPPALEVEIEAQDVTQNVNNESNLCIDLTEEESIVNENNVESDSEVQCISAVIANPELCIIREKNINRRKRVNRSDRSRSPIQRTDRNNEQNDDIIEITNSQNSPNKSNAKPMTPSKTSRKIIKCPVCLDEDYVFKVSGRQLVSTNCGHLFCDRCIKEVIKTTKTCPNCRKKIATQKSFHPIYL